jgi:hypothetical protein
MPEAAATDRNSVWSRYLRDRESIWRVFREFRDSGDPVSLRFEAVDTAFTARIQDVDHRRVTLGDVQPPDAEALIDAGKSFALAGRSNGAYVYAPGNRRTLATNGAENTFVIELPTELLWQQRRRGPRYPVPAALRAGRARLTLVQGRHTLEGSIEDISAHGCRASFPVTASDVLSRHDAFDDAQLDIGGLLSIKVRLALRHRATAESKALTCGFEITRIAAADQARLEQFLRSLAKRASAG